MKFTSSLITVGAILIASASLSFSRALPGVSSVAVSSFEDIPNCLDGLCVLDRSEPLKVRAGTSSGAGAAAGEAAGSRVPPPVVPAPEVVGGPGAGTRRPGPDDPQAPKSPRPIAAPAPEPVAGPAAEEGSTVQSWVRPPGLDGPVESQFWTDTTSRIASPDFNSIKPNEGTALYTGKAAWTDVEDFGTELGTALGRPIRHYLNTVKSDPQLQGMIKSYDDNPAGQGWTLPNGVASLELVSMAREIPNDVHVLFNTPEEAAAAAERGEIPKGHLKYFEMHAITSESTKVPRVLAWDAETWRGNLGNKDYQPPVIWTNGQPPLGLPADFTTNSRARTD
ncbi:hypothetical protein GQ53DRAFT_832562 [Thozetella sp. PMI_491]|nr:hypothetical protein GQ53DRAFT_832562 [Thozetella sp. PMI_491]